MASGNQGSPAGEDGVFAVEPADGGPVGPGSVAHCGCNGGVVGEVALPPGVQVVLQSENGILGVGPYPTADEVDPIEAGTDRLSSV